MRRLSTTHGFSLIQISVLLTIGAIIMASLLPGSGAGDFNKKIAGDVNKLDAVEAATITFMAKYGRRPCPADGSYDVNAANFGLEAGTPGTCTSTNLMGPDSSGAGYVIAGVIPTKTLNLPDDYAFDAWGRRFTYTVDKRATSTSACYARQNAGATGGIVIKNTNGGTTLDNVMVAYIDHGADGNGAFPAGGSNIAGRTNKGSTDTDTLINAGVDSSFVYSTAIITNTRIKKEKTTTFDDLVYYRGDTMNTCCIGTGCNTHDATSNPSAYGFVAQGASSTATGTSLASGDINGDGIDDLIIGAPTGAGKVYVIFGSKSVFSSPITMNSYNGSNGGVIFSGASGSDAFGTSVAVGDVNGDGIKDIIVGAPGYNSSKGAVYVVFGKTTAFSNTTVSSPDGTTYFRIDINTGDLALGTSVASGNINGDVYATSGAAVDDIIIGAPTTSSNAGKVYVVFGIGGSTPTPLSSGVFALTSIASSTKGFEIDGNSSGKAGSAVASGDVNGDGIADVMVGAPNATVGAVTTAGKTYVIFGNAGTWNTGTANPTILANLNGATAVNGTNGVIINGTTSGDLSGTSLSTGDINGDSIADLIIGAPTASAGMAYVVYGKATWTSPVALSGLTVTVAPLGFKLNGTAGDKAGTSVASGCSLNGNGIAPILVGGPNSTNGTAYTVLGASTGWTNSSNLSALTGTNGFATSGISSGDKAGTSVAITNINGVGTCALAVGAPTANSVYVVLGKTIWSTPFDLSTLR